MFILHRGWASIGKTYGIMSTYQNFHKRLKKLTLKSKLINILKDFLLTLLTMNKWVYGNGQGYYDITNGEDMLSKLQVKGILSCCK